MNDNRPTHLDLFSGIGGFALAFEREGFRTIGFSEIESFASKILKQNWPSVPNFGDIRNVPDIRCDVLTGGFPCQPFSLAGKRKGESDDRHLWPAMLDVIGRVKPSWLLLENVAGFLTMGIDKLLDGLEEGGYQSQIFCVPACAAGMDQERMRVWIVASNTNTVSLRPQRKRKATQEPWSREQFEGLVQADLRLCVPAGNSGRVSYGLPNRSHRLKGLGNAIVPQVAQIFARAIYQQVVK